MDWCGSVSGLFNSLQKIPEGLKHPPNVIPDDAGA